MKNIHLQLRNLIGQIESAMIQSWLSQVIKVNVYFFLHIYTGATKIILYL